jgi:two-component system cell cycle response regulator CtrA
VKILLIGSPHQQPGSVAMTLSDAGFVVFHADDATEAKSLLRHDEFDLAVLVAPLNAADMSGVVRGLRSAKATSPLLVIAVAPAFATAATLTAGADDVMPVTHLRNELVARCKALFRRSQGICEQVIRVGPLSFDMDSLEVTFNGRRIGLTKRECDILEILVQRKNKAVSKNTIMTHLYALERDEPDSKIVDVFICKLRRKLHNAGVPNLIKTVWGIGYQLVDQDASVDMRQGLQPGDEEIRALGAKGTRPLRHHNSLYLVST